MKRFVSGKPFESSQIALSCLASALLVSAATAGVPSAPAVGLGNVQFVLFGEVASGSGYDFIEVVGASQQVIAPLDRLFSAGAFANGDYTTEYVIGSENGTLYTLDVTTGAESLIGATGSSGARMSMRWNPLAGTMTAVQPEADCSSSLLTTIDITTGLATPIGSLGGVCAQSMAIDASANIYLLDAATSSLDRIDGTTGDLETIGPLGFAFGPGAAMDIDVTSGMLFLYDFDGTHAMYAVDTTNGFAQALGPLGDDFPTLTAFAFGFTSAATIFADGFEVAQ
jgi:hypothetical protein